MRLCRIPCGMALPFRADLKTHLAEAKPRRNARLARNGKAKPYRTKAAKPQLKGRWHFCARTLSRDIL